jgi:hypothetical protein
MSNHRLERSDQQEDHQSDPLVQIYLTRRCFTLLDEWLFYSMLVFLILNSFSYFIIGPVLIYGTLAIITSYRNLHRLEVMLGLPEQEIFWPIC